MASIYTIFSAEPPECEVIERACGEAYRWVSVENIQQLSQYQGQKGIVLLSSTMENLATHAGLIRNYAPQISVVVVTQEVDIPLVTPETLQHADLLVLPASPAEIEVRLTQAMMLSELRHAMVATVQMDEITGLYSYASFLKRLTEEMSLSKRHQAPLACVILSISFFDVFIDSYGYHFAAGLMEQVSAEIKTQARSEDITARLGDGEVGFLLPHSTEKGALSLTQRVLEKVQFRPFTIGSQTEQVELKAGIAGFPVLDEPDIDADTLIRYTRHALHHAKCSDRVSIQLFGQMKPVIG